VLIVFIVNDSPTNIDFIDIGNPCNRKCSSCFKSRVGGAPDREEELDLVQKIKIKNKNSNFFLYPNEATTSPYLFSMMVENGQKYTLTNGLLLDERMVNWMLVAGLQEVKVTYFANVGEQIEWQGISAKQYRLIGKNIENAVKNGLKVSVNNVLWKSNVGSICDLTKKCFDLGVSRIQLIRFRGFEPDERYLSDSDMDNVVGEVEKAKQLFPNNPRVQFSYTFAGPNFYGKSFEEVKGKVSPKEWINSPYLCPAIGQNYWGISLKNSSVYWCPFIAGDKDAEIGKLDKKTGEVNISTNIDLRPETLRKKLGGKCSEDSCEYQSLCLGGCRSTAYIFANMRGEKDPLYAGIDICLTDVYGRALRR